MYRFLFALTATILFADAGKLPDYIKPCKRDDPNLNECVKQHAIDAIPNILKGDRDLKIPNLQPLNLTLIEIKPSDAFFITLKDIVLSGLENVIIEDIQFDLAKKHILVKVSFSHINILCNYVMDGQILILPIKGSGPGNLTYENVVVDFGFDYQLTKKDDGKEYIDSNFKPTITYVLGKSYYHFDNLFNGNKVLGDKMNEFLNEHGPEVNNDLGQTVSQTIAAVVTNLLQLITSVVPYDELFV